MRRVPENPIHRLVTLGDSLVQGFQNGCIHRTDLSFPALLARAMDPKMRFDQADFTAQGGLPLNLEALIRGLEQPVGKTLEPEEWARAVRYVISTANRVKRYWEGRVRPLAVPHYTPYHNQSVWGATLSDVWLLSEEACRREIETHKASLTAIGFLPDHAQYVTASRVLNPSSQPMFAHHTALDNVRWFSENGGIENLVLWLGSNNVVGAVTTLKAAAHSEGDSGRMPGRRNGSFVPVEVFRRDFSYLARQLANMNIKNVFAGTIPYVTYPPLLAAPGISGNSRSKFEAPFLTHPWLLAHTGLPEELPNLSRSDVLLLNETVDGYNRCIREICDSHGFHVVPMNRFVAALCTAGDQDEPADLFPDGLRAALQQNPATAYLVKENGHVALTADYLQVGPDGRLVRGGIFSLDGLHPTTIGYGMVAHLFRWFMKKKGVRFERGIDWDFVVKNDTLINQPPVLLLELHLVLRILSAGVLRSLRSMGVSYVREIAARLSLSKS